MPGETKLGRRFLRSSEGSAAVEFAIVLNLLLLMIMGMLEFGLAFSMKQVIINASREGARYGVVYQVDAQGIPVLPTQRTPSISNWVLDSASGGLGLRSMLPADSNPQVSVVLIPTGPPPGNNLQVRVTCEYPFWVMNKLIPVLGDKMTLAGTTVMRVE